MSNNPLSIIVLWGSENPHEANALLIKVLKKILSLSFYSELKSYVKHEKNSSKNASLFFVISLKARS